MRNLILGILVAAVAILGFFSYQSSQQGNTLQAEKAALTAEVARLQGLVDQRTQEVESEVSALGALADKASELEAALAASAGQVLSLEADKAALAAQVAGLEAEKATLAEAAAALQAELDAQAAEAPAGEGATNP
jgi:chromosome segregation ATPase